MTRAEFVKKFRTIYFWLLRNNPELLDKKFPKQLNYNHLELLKKRYELGLGKPSQVKKEEKNLYDFINYQLQKDKNWLKNTFPRWGETKKEKSLKRMLELMPEDLVSFKEGQEWRGTHHKHIFICKKYGEFESQPTKLMSQSWNNGTSGHPDNKKESGRLSKKPVKIKETGQTFNSCKECAKSLNASISYLSICLSQNKKCKGYTLEYVEENEKKEI